MLEDARPTRQNGELFAAHITEFVALNITGSATPFRPQKLGHLPPLVAREGISPPRGAASSLSAITEVVPSNVGGSG